MNLSGVTELERAPLYPLEQRRESRLWRESANSRSRDQNLKVMGVTRAEKIVLGFGLGIRLLWPAGRSNFPARMCDVR